MTQTTPISAPLRIVVMGTPDFAVETLKRLDESRHEVVGVVTTPDRRSGRGRKLSPSAVKRYALQGEMAILHPERLRDEHFLAALTALNADLFVVVAFRMLPEIVWRMPPKGTFNLHASLLPDYRGAAPINWAIIAGEKETGATTFYIDDRIDTGDILYARSMSISEDETAGSLHDKLMVMGADLVLETVEAIAAGEATPRPQKTIEGAPLKRAPKIFSEDRLIDWTNSAQGVRNLVRGMSPYPSAMGHYITSDGEQLPIKILEVQETESIALAPGAISSDGKTYIEVGTGSSDLRISSLQLPGKRQMTVSDVLNGGLLDLKGHFGAVEKG